MENEHISAFQFPNEIWIEIFNYLDFPNLLELSLVCKHWNHLIFTHLAHRIKLTFDLDLLKYPPRCTTMVNQRYYKHLCLRSFKLDSPDYLFMNVKQLAVHLDTLELELVFLDCKYLVQLLEICTRLKTLCIKANYFECDDTIEKSTAELPAIRSLSLNVEKYVSTFDTQSFKISILKALPNVRELRTILYRPLDLITTLWMSERLRALKATVSSEATNDFLRLQLPALQILNLTLLQPESNWRKRRTFQASAFRDFLMGCKSLKKALLSFRCEYDQQLLTVIFTSLPRVEELQLSGGLATERFSLIGLEKMKFLKTLKLHCLLLFKEDDYVVPMPSVEIFSMCTYIKPKKFADILKRFPNLRSLSFRMHGDELQSVGEVVPLLEELSVDIGRITPEMISYIQQLISLKKINIDANSIARTNFRLLRNVITLPALRRLHICTGSSIPPNNASLLAATNQACALVLNGELVKPAVRVRRTGVKRKSTASATTPTIKPVNTSPSSIATEENQQTESDASANGSLLASSLDNSNPSFAMVKCSSPAENSFANNLSIDVSAVDESTDGAYVSAASSADLQNSSHDQGNDTTNLQ